MSFRVLVIPEDFEKDQYVLKPIFERMFESIGKKALVRICTEPRLRGVQDALKESKIAEILDRNRAMVHCFVLVVDRDAEEKRRAVLDRMEAFAKATLPDGRYFLAENAWQEVEVWLLAGHDLPSDWAWKDIRGHRDSKEAYYEPFARSRGVFDGPAQGRATLGREAATRYGRIRQLCTEVDDLEQRIKEAAGV